MLIPPNGKPTQYIVSIVGLSSCTFDISYTTTSLKIYELKHSHLFNIQLTQDEKIYFIYYHSQNESLRVAAMSNFGQIDLRAAILNTSFDKLNETKWTHNPINPDMSLLI